MLVTAKIAPIFISLSAVHIWFFLYLQSFGTSFVCSCEKLQIGERTKISVKYFSSREVNISYLQAALWCYIYYINTNEMPIHFTLFFLNLAKKFRLALRSCVVFFFVFLIGSLSLTLYTQTSACLFSILFFIHFLWHWQYLIQQWYLVEILDDRQPQRWNGVAMCLSTLSSQSSMNLDLEIKLDWIVIVI